MLSTQHGCSTQMGGGTAMGSGTGRGRNRYFFSVSVVLFSICIRSVSISVMWRFQSDEVRVPLDDN